MKLLFALAGNQNSGKTTLFNRLTGSNQHVGNFPGVTVEKKEGPIKKRQDAVVVDLPGIYSLSPYTSEEIVTRDFVLNEHPNGIINIVDATNIERNLYLSLQLIELGIPMVIALNMMDEVRASGNSIDVMKLSAELGVPVVPISAGKNEGIDELVDVAIRTASEKQPPLKYDFCDGRGPQSHPRHRPHRGGPGPGKPASPSASPPPSWWRATSPPWPCSAWTTTRSISSSTSLRTCRTSWAPTGRPPWRTCAIPLSKRSAPSVWSSTRRPGNRSVPSASTGS